jgi:hypothetical protein
LRGHADQHQADRVPEEQVELRGDLERGHAQHHGKQRQGEIAERRYAPSQIAIS